MPPERLCPLESGEVGLAILIASHPEHRVVMEHLAEEGETVRDVLPGVENVLVPIVVDLEIWHERLTFVQEVEYEEFAVGSFRMN